MGREGLDGTDSEPTRALELRLVRRSVESGKVFGRRKRALDSWLLTTRLLRVCLVGQSIPGYSCTPRYSGDGACSSCSSPVALLMSRSLGHQSATYLLAHKSIAAAGSTSNSTNPSRTSSPSPSNASSAPREQGHSDAIWCCKWSTLPSGEGILVTAGADHTIKTWCVFHRE